MTDPELAERVLARLDSDPFGVLFTANLTQHNTAPEDGRFC